MSDLNERERYIAEITRRVQEGSYNPTGEEVAGAMMAQSLIRDIDVRAQWRSEVDLPAPENPGIFVYRAWPAPEGTEMVAVPVTAVDHMEKTIGKQSAMIYGRDMMIFGLLIALMAVMGWAWATVTSLPQPPASETGLSIEVRQG